MAENGRYEPNDRTLDKRATGEPEAGGCPQKSNRTGTVSGKGVSPINGQPLPEGRPFRAGDERAKQAGRASGAARRRKADLRELCKAWMETTVGKDKDGKKITGGEMMIKVAAKEINKGNPRFWELMRDTAGYKPIDRVMVSEVDPTVIAEVEAMVLGADEDD